MKKQKDEREIKFHVVHTKSIGKKFATFPEDYLLSGDGKLYHREEETLYECDKSVIPVFFTGLKDKNGKEIYEGDIIKSDDKNHVIVYEKQLTGYGYFTRPNDYDSFIYLYGDYYEIIGNIYENPELLKGLK